MGCAFRSPNTNALVERLVQSIKQECLEKMLVFGEPHLRYIVSEYVDYYDQERPHQGRDNLPPMGEEMPEFSEPAVIACRERLGGLLKHLSAGGAGTTRLLASAQAIPKSMVNLDPRLARELGKT